MGRRGRWMGGGVAALVLAACTPTLDTTFGDGDGIVTLHSFDGADHHPIAVLEQPDGKVVVSFQMQVVGSLMVLARLNADGTPDATFGTAGMVVTDFQSFSTCGDLLLTADGKYLASVAVPNGSEHGIARFHRDGGLDTTFGVGGLAYVTNFDACDLELLPDGRIVSIGGRGFSIQAARWDADGTLDPTFGSAGVAEAFPTSDFYIRMVTSELAVQPDGRIVGAGFTGGKQNVPDHALVVRFNADGTPDDSFDGDGKVVLERSAHLSEVVVRPDGAILVGASDLDAGILLVQLTAAGQLDQSFGSGGIASAAAADAPQLADLALLGDGQVMLAGASSTGNESAGDYEVLLARFGTDGVLDESFGAGGISLTDEFDGSEGAYAIALQEDEKLIVAGAMTTVPNGPLDVALYRFFVD